MNLTIDSELLTAEESYKAHYYISLLHKTYASLTKKCDDAFADGLISESEYDEWIEFFETTRKTWLNKDFTEKEDVTFLIIMTRHLISVNKKLDFKKVFA
jgi:hypothetical protein